MICAYTWTMANAGGDQHGGGPTWLRRAFLAPAALWMIAQAHFGSFIGAWRDDASLAGNMCWLLICYCLGYLLLQWGVQSVRLRTLSGDILFLLAALGTAELLWQALQLAAAPLVWTGLIAFLMQPLLVLLGLAVVHRNKLSFH